MEKRQTKVEQLIEKFQQEVNNIKTIIGKSSPFEIEEIKAINKLNTEEKQNWLSASIEGYKKKYIIAYFIKFMNENFEEINSLTENDKIHFYYELCKAYAQIDIVLEKSYSLYIAMILYND